MPRSALTFLEVDPSPRQRLRALTAHMRLWLVQGAEREGREVRREDGVTWVATPGPDGEAWIAYPRLPAARAGAQLDAIMDEYRRSRPLPRVGCWSMIPARPRDLGVRLMARGFGWGWRPHWMWLELHGLQEDQRSLSGLAIAIADDESQWEVDDLPKFHRGVAYGPVPEGRSQRAWHFAAQLDGRIVGHSVLFVTTGRLGVAGIFDVGVVPAARRQGIGTAVTLAACRLARELGCRHAVLNATPLGEGVYRRLGFVSMGYGQTWWLQPETLAAPPPTPAQVAFAEAVARGDLAALDALGGQLLPDTPDAPLANGMSPLQLAVKMGQPKAATWLVAHGATLDILSAWDLGWKDRVPRLLAESPDLGNRRSGDWQATPLHEAAVRGDVELARLLLAANPALDAQDATFHSTPLGWARHFGRTEIAELIEQHQEERRALGG